MPLLTCAICGAENPVVTGPLPEAAQAPDFDTRPGEPLRSTLHRWLQQCHDCGYAAEDITHASPEAESIIRSDDYQRVRFDARAPAEARPFLCYAHLLSRLHQHADAGWSCLHAAWACDDVGDAEAAVDCRTRAIAMWQTGKEAGKPFSDDMASEFALITDIYRRMGEFEQATVACAEGLDIEDVPPALDAILRRQMTLILSRDTSAHSLRELMRQGA